MITGGALFNHPDRRVGRMGGGRRHPVFLFDYFFFIPSFHFLLSFASIFPSFPVFHCPSFPVCLVSWGGARGAPGWHPSGGGGGWGVAGGGDAGTSSSSSSSTSFTQFPPCYIFLRPRLSEPHSIFLPVNEGIGPPWRHLLTPPPIN